MFYRAIAIVTILLATLTSSSVCAGDSWWSNPFKSKPKTSESANDSYSSASKKEWKMPDPNAPVNVTKQTPSMISKMGTTTKAWWKKTCEILAPYPTDSDGKSKDPATVGELLAQPRIKF